MKQMITTSKTFIKVFFLMCILIGCVSKVHAQRDPFLWPFTSTSIWNMPIGSDAVYQPAGFKKVTDFANVPPYNRGGIAVDDEPIIVSKSSDPLRTVYNISDWSFRCNTTSTSGKQIRFPSNLTYADPNGSVNTPNFSGAVVQPDGSLWHFNAITTCGTDKIAAYDYTSLENSSLTSTGYEGGHGGSGLSGIGGSIRKGELLASTPIRHAIKLNVLASRYLVYNNDGTPGYRWPANRADGYANPAGNSSFGYGTSNTNNFNYMEMGALVAIQPSATPQSLGITNPIAIKIFYALQDYGAYIVDDTYWNHYDIPLEEGVVDEVLSATGTNIRNFDQQSVYYQDMFKIITALYAITNNSPTSIGGGGTPRQPLAPDFAQVAVTSVSVDPAVVSIEVGALQTLTESVSPNNASNKVVTWSSSNEAVATVSVIGIVKGIAAGVATITATTADGNKTATSVVTVTAIVPTVKLTGTTIGTPGSYDNDPTVTNDKAMDGDLTTFFDAAQPDGNWVGLDLGSAKIISRVKFCPRASWAVRLIGGKIQGSNVADFSVAVDLFTITETPAENVLTARTINNTTGYRYVRYFSPNGGYGNIAEIEFHRLAATVSVTGVSLSPTTASVGVGGNTSLTATVAPTDATEQKVNWTSGNNAIATVSGSGVVSGVAVGTVTITATTQDGNKTATCTVTVTPKVVVTGVTVSPTAISIAAGATTTLAATIAPSDATITVVTWTSSNTAIATVSSTGLVTGKTAGNATITAITQDGNFTSDATITVSAVANKSFKIMPLGDSKVEGGGTGGHFTWRGYLRARLLQDGYTINYVGPRSSVAPGDGIPNDLDHAGFGGYTIGPDSQTFCGTCETTGVFEHIQDYFVANDPDVVLLALGINDLFNGGSHPANYSSTAPQRYQDLVNKILQIKPSVKIIVGTIDPVKWDQSWGGDPLDNGLGALNAKIKAIADASATDNIYFADIRNKFLTTFSAADFYDDIHFSQQGATKVADAWYHAVVPVLTGQSTTVAVASVVVSPATVSISAGSNTALTATIAPLNATNKNVTWSSGNTAIATVTAAGVVSGLAEGTATITVTTTDGNKTAVSVVTVTAGNGTYDYEAENGTYGGGGRTQATSNASNGFVVGNLNAVGSYSQVSSVNGGSGGTATLVIRYSNGFSSTSEIGLYVNNVFIQNVSFPVTGGWNNFSNVTVSISLPTGTGNTIKLQIASGNTAADIDKYSVTPVAAVAVTEVTITPTSASVTAGASIALTATVAPSNASNKNVSWASSNTDVATVNSSGLVNALAAGSATITVTTQSGNKTGTSAITVTAVLPVKYVSFNVILEKAKVKLSWSTALEVNSKNFKVQRSIDGINFETIATLPAAGNSNIFRNYGYDDINVVELKGKQIFYRILETDIDERTMLTEVKSVKMPDFKNLFTIVYNPVKNEALLKYECSEKDKVMIRVMDNMGRIISIVEKVVNPGINQIRLETGKLTSGIYEIELMGKNDHLHIRMMKE